MGARTAAVTGGYLNGEQGTLIYTDDELYDQLKLAYKTGKSVSVHSIGDIALTQLMNAIKKLGAGKIKFPEFRIEHGQFMNREHAFIAKENGITPHY